VTLKELNDLARDAAERELARCCGSTRWAAAMAARRPFGDAGQLQRAAEEIWWSLDGADWLEAFSHHPRIGERGAGAGWAKDEQAGVAGAAAAVLESLAERNHEYERRFGHVFLICATGKRADDMLANLEQRIANDPATELRIAAGEQAKITQLRLDKLLAAPRNSSRIG
jgi:2-oxo-4-hydroxy-4-carboxy-5-ureidoimidazoline decarboxylase